ncbi:uncharacterized protein V1510DRAFT_403989 [Dipodascopsis tothii]|uniref:uncharacterized protein n=1 Tax=Dipodascopsis tothii TaxID=44089 RepID=UPI0034CD9E2E
MDASGKPNPQLPFGFVPPADDLLGEDQIPSESSSPTASSSTSSPVSPNFPFYATAANSGRESSAFEAAAGDDPFNQPIRNGASYRSSREISFNSIVLVECGTQRPAKPFTYLIALALLSAPNYSMAIDEVYRFLSSHFPFFKMSENDVRWKSGVRHNLSYNLN